MHFKFSLTQNSIEKWVRKAQFLIPNKRELR